MKLAVKETNELKRMVKKVTGRNMKDIEIEAFGNDCTKNKRTYDKITLK